MKTAKGCQEGVGHRRGDLDGEIRHKRGDTLVRTLRQTCGNDLAPGVRSDMPSAERRTR